MVGCWQKMPWGKGEWSPATLSRLVSSPTCSSPKNWLLEIVSQLSVLYSDYSRVLDLPGLLHQWVGNIGPEKGWGGGSGDIASSFQMGGGGGVKGGTRWRNT